MFKTPGKEIILSDEQSPDVMNNIKIKDVLLSETL